MVERFGSIAIQAFVLVCIAALGRVYTSYLNAHFGFSRTTGVAEIKTWLKAHPRWAFSTSILTFAVCGPALEETLFRALLVQYGTCDTAWGWMAIIAVSAAFATSHRDRFVESVQQFSEHPASARHVRWAKRVRIAVAFLTGILYAWVGIATHSLFAAFLVHAAWNLLVVTRLLVLVPILLFALAMRAVVALDDAVFHPIRIARTRRRMRRVLNAQRRSL